MRTSKLLNGSLKQELLILGCGFTGSRVARRWLERGNRVVAVRRSDIDFTEPGALERLKPLAIPGCVVLHSIPTLPHAADARLLRALEGSARRVVYLSTTSVYGEAHEVNEQTPICPVTDRAKARADTERTVQSGPWRSLILRPAAIYGPGRYARSGDASNRYVSRVHVDDLGGIVEAALLTDVEGAFPVADEHPCPSWEVAEYRAGLLGVPVPAAVASRGTGRRVDGSAICRALGLTLRYPSYREGIPACLAAELSAQL